MTKFKDKYQIETARRPNWDYGDVGWYFITICTKNRQCFFGEITNQSMKLSAIGQTADQFWQEIPQHTKGTCHLDTYQIMPNHLHGIIVIEPVETLQCNVSTPNNSTKSKNETMANISPKTGQLGTILRSYKSAVTYWCNNHSFDFGWQTRFHDRVIRNERELNAIRQYITNNPTNWANDRNNQPGLFM